MIKQVIVMRKDLNMRKGKMAAQASHSSMKVFFDRILSIDRGRGLMMLERITDDMADWAQEKFTKIVVSVNSEEELVAITKQAWEAKLPVALITDCGATEFHGVPTKTCCAIGPADAEEIDKITGELPLL